ncbi:hypothetical protein F4677DRAFT_436023 [Hypoxylon crocopeplum]|nr:hypothetical protein F4677DRAFT_436023 [Hypoxylon crocopeplum]
MRYTRIQPHKPYRPLFRVQPRLAVFIRYLPVRMSGAELPLAILGTIDLCFKYGERLMKMCRAFKAAEEELAERTLRVEAGWMKTEMQLRFMKQVEDLMGKYHRAVNERTVEVLLAKLKVVVSSLERVVKMPDEADENASVVPKRWKYALFKESIDGAIEELEIWQRSADPTWYLILRMADSQIDRALRYDNSATITSFPSVLNIRGGLQSEDGQEIPGVFLPARELDNLTTYDIPLCNTRRAERLSSRRGLQVLLLDRMECPPNMNINAATKDVRDLARKLRHDDPLTFGLLSCKGVIKQVDSSNYNLLVSFTMVFRSPDGLSRPESLRGKLRVDDGEITLSDKFDIARQIARAVSYIHTFGFVHKNIRPETILTFRQPNTTAPSVFVAGFDKFRKEEGRTYRRGDDDWEKNLYRHPSRQSSSPEEEYVMQHDIYSLGVCLLEIGLYESFVSYDPEGNNPRPSPALRLPPSNSQITEGIAMKDHLVSLAHNQLPRCMGRKYTEIVNTCLTCLDPNNTSFGDEREFMDKDGILVGVRYIEKVFSQLNAICV